MGRAGLTRRLASFAASTVGFTALAAATIAAAAPVASRPSLPRSSLAVLRGETWVPFWRAETAPVRWMDADPRVASAVGWRRIASGVEVGELKVSGNGEAWRLRTVLVRIDPARARLSLAAAIDDAALHGRWTIDSAAASAQVAVNAGQFSDATPWGWLVHEGREINAPGIGPLSMSVALDRDGRVHFAGPDSIATLRASNRIVEAIQSYPTLLERDGDVPRPLRTADAGIDVAHRDSRLAIGELRDGKILLLLTRFDALGGAAASLPFGPTVPETAALIGALGARRAVMLDGGLSGQMLVRGAGAWRGLRNVPLGIVFTTR